MRASDEGEGQLFLLVADDQGPQVGVEGAEEDEDGERGEDRLGEGQDSVAIDAEVAAAVDFDGVVEPSILLSTRLPDQLLFDQFRIVHLGAI